jgi:hypothetical protein
MFGISTCLMLAALLSVQAPNATGDAAPQTDASALPRYDEAPAPIADFDPAAPAPILLTPKQIRHSRRVGLGLTIAGGVFLAAGVTGLIVGISGLAASPSFGPGFFERERRAEMRGIIGAGIGVPCMVSGVAFSIAGAAFRAQARSAPKLQVSILPTWLHGGGGLTVGGRF